jgi:GT2 family glycosyltransferase
MNTFSSQQIGVVVIGRNEGERLATCLKSLVGRVAQVVYVDSGSTDDSIATAQKLGVVALKLDMTQAFTAARARNFGFDFLIKNQPELHYVQFIDGDCELANGWIAQGLEFLNMNAQFAVVCGRRRERFPTASIYNLLCDLEWDTPVGETKSCGGDALMRIDALQTVNGFNESLIAGEEPELCLRLRQADWKIYRLDVEMTLHDAAISQFWQWWKRSQRAGYAFAEGAYLHGMSPERHWLKETVSIIFWGGVLPLVLLILSFVNSWFLLGWIVYPLQILKITLKNTKLNSTRLSSFYAFFVILAKFPQMMGILTYGISHISKNKQKIIEYK